LNVHPRLMSPEQRAASIIAAFLADSHFSVHLAPTDPRRIGERRKGSYPLLIRNSLRSFPAET
jgi:hypothetical protein